MKTFVLLQCRLNSSRLPAKALLPISGYPSIVLATKRAMNSGLNICVALSDHPESKHIIPVLKEHEIEFYQGDHESPLKRFYDIGRQLGAKDDDIIIRLTGDNVVPDGAFLEGVIGSFVEQKLDYLNTLGTNLEQSWMPYGVSAEAFYYKGLKQSYLHADTPEDHEHVTTRLRNDSQSIKGYYTPVQQDYSHLNCTLDTYEDYIRLLEVFDDIKNPLDIGWREIIDKMNAKKR